MFTLKKILAPIDFSERATGAIRYAEALAEHFESRLILLHVLPPPHYEFASMEVGGAVLSELFQIRTEQVQTELDAFASEEMPNLSAERVLVEGDPASKIVEYAHEEQVDLIVLPTHGHGPFRRFIVGSVTAKVLHDADCPVWTGVHLEDAPSVERIACQSVTVAVDCGAQCGKVLAWASEFADAWQARLTLVHATPTLEIPDRDPGHPEWREKLCQEVSDAIQTMQKRAGANAEVVIECGDAPAVVCNTANRTQTDLLVIGRGSAAGVFGRLRTNAYAIIRQSPCPVVSV
ncbi:universal stress protein [Candidatus Bipolaricaulota bacterium]|nr:universal stress protein [Candidatus Bipolaricaulota bacterium]